MTFVTNFYWNWRKEVIGWIGDVTGLKRQDGPKWIAASARPFGKERLIFMTGTPIQDTVRGPFTSDADVLSKTLEGAVRKAVRQIFEVRP